MNKALVVAVYALLLSAISFNYSKTYSASTPTQSLIDRDDPTVPDTKGLSHTEAATVPAARKENPTTDTNIADNQKHDAKVKLLSDKNERLTNEGNHGHALEKAEQSKHRVKEAEINKEIRGKAKFQRKGKQWMR